MSSIGATGKEIKMGITKNQKEQLLKKVDEINTAEGLRDSYEEVGILWGELRGMIEMI